MLDFQHRCSPGSSPAVARRCLVSTFACAASVLVARLPADPQPVSQANQVLREDAASSSSRAMRLRTRRTCWADHDPRLESVGIFLAVSAAAKAPDDVMPPARNLVRIGAKLAARASAWSDWPWSRGCLWCGPGSSRIHTWRSSDNVPTTSSTWQPSARAASKARSGVSARTTQRVRRSPVVITNACAIASPLPFPRPDHRRAALPGIFWGLARQAALSG